MRPGDSAGLSSAACIDIIRYADSIASIQGGRKVDDPRLHGGPPRHCMNAERQKKYS